MKLLVRKLYCRNCQRLVRGQEQNVNGNIHVSCSRCNALLWVWNGINWRHAGREA